MGGTPKLTYVGFVVDMSGSMTGLETETKNMFKSIVMELGKDPNTFVTLNVFNHKTKFVHINKRADLVKDMQYSPHGSTSLYDAIGETINQLKNNYSDTEDQAFLLMVITDGEENASTVYNADSIKKLVSEVKETGKWTLTYGGPSKQFAEFLGITNVTLFENKRETIQNFTQRSVAGTASYMALRSAGNLSVGSFYSED